MNREYLFRGKRLDNGEWVEGYLAKCQNDINRDIAYILPSVVTLGFEVYGVTIGGFVETDQSTICQYTGMVDRNGKKIFEGDVVKHRLVLYETMRTGVVEYSDNFGAYFIIGSGYTDNQMYAFCDFEVIGNKWDNPELLGIK